MGRVARFATLGRNPVPSDVSVCYLWVGRIGPSADAESPVGGMTINRFGVHTLPMMLQRPARTGRDRARDLAVNLGIFALMWAAYSLGRQVTLDAEAVAMENARRIVDLQAWMGLPSERAIQAAIIDRAGLVKIANYYYLLAHFPGTAAFMVWAWWRHRERFPGVRSSLLAVTAAGLALHIAFPLAPPRMLPGSGFIDTGRLFGPNPYDLGIAEAANQLAAMPSLHVGWSLLVAIGILGLSDSRWRWLALAHPAITTTVVVITANHYWLDGLAAAVLVVVAWKAFRRDPEWDPGREPIEKHPITSVERGEPVSTAAR